MAENKVVIKINYDANKRPSTSGDVPKMVTVWHTRRIFAAVVVLTLIVCLPIIWIGGDDKAEVAKVGQNLQEEEKSIVHSEIKVNQGDGVNAVKTENLIPFSPAAKQASTKVEPASNSVKRPPAIIYDKSVIRASLNTGAKDKEPYQPAKLPIILHKGQSIEVFYFNELRSIKGKPLFHHWIKDGLTVDKKRLAINDKKLKVVSSKTLFSKDSGEWQIQLVDGKGKVYSEVSFSVRL